MAIELKCINERVNLGDGEKGQICYVQIPGLDDWLDNGAIN